MATNLEIEKEQMDKLFELLMLQKQNQGMPIKGLAESLARAKASMKKENIAWVEQMVNSLP